MEYLHPSSSLWIFPVFFLTGFISGLVDAIAGGGGLITLPVLLGMGIPPQVALATNKLQASFGSFTAAWAYVRHGSVRLKETVPGIIFTFIGAAAGTILVQKLDNQFLSTIIPFLLLVIFVYTLFTPNLGTIDTHSPLKPGAFYFIFGLCIGFYDGFFGPGTGSFWALAFVVGLGFNLSKATAYTKVMNFTSNVVSLLFFLIGGAVWLSAGICMGIGQVCGARIGAGMVIKRGVGLVRPVYLTVVVLTMIKLFYQRYF